MSYTTDNDFQLITEGAGDWDTGLRANWQIAERGFHFRSTAGATISSGQILWMTSSQYLVPYDSRSSSLRWPHAIAYKNVSSGASETFLAMGVVRSMTVWSGGLVVGRPVYVKPNSLGFAVSSFIGAAFPAGIAIGPDAIFFNPGITQFPELVTEIQSTGPVIVNSYGDFAVSLAHRGIARTLRITAQSADAYKVYFHSNSTRVASELLYETQTLSSAVGSVDVRTRNYEDSALFPVRSTNENSLSLIYGRIMVQSGSSVASSNFQIELLVERFR